MQALVGAAVVTLALALAFTQNRAANASSDVVQLNAGTRSPGLTTSFDLFAPSDLNQLRRLAPDVLQLDVLGNQDISGVEVGQNFYKLSDSRATGPDYAAITGLKVLHGSYFNRKDVDAGAKVLALSANTATTLFGRENAVGETVKVVSNGQSTRYKVVAVTEASQSFQRGSGSPLLIPLTVSRANSLLMKARPGQLPEAKAQLLSAIGRIYESDPMLRSTITAGQSGFFYNPLNDPFGQARTGSSPMLRAYFTIAALTLIVSSLGVLAALLVSVNERTRELGLRRAIGATRGQIIASLLLETLLTTLLGSVFGIGLAALLLPVLNTQLVSLLGGASLLVSPGLALFVLGLFVGLSLLFGLLPAVASTRMRPTEALRVQG